MNKILGITINATRDEMDAEGIIPDANWQEAWDTFVNMMTGAALALFPDAEIEVIEQPSVQGITVVADTPDARDDDHDEMMDVAERVFEVWCGWVGSQEWIA